MILAGGGMVVGNQVSALFADRFKPGALPVISGFWRLLRFCSPSSSPLRLGICGADVHLLRLSFGIGRLSSSSSLKHAGGGEMLGGCCIQGAFNLGNAMGAFLGGIPVCDGIGIQLPCPYRCQWHWQEPSVCWFSIRNMNKNAIIRNK